MLGLIVEFMGVLLISWEWFAAQRQEATERAIEAQHAQAEASMAHLQRVSSPDPNMERHYAMTQDVRQRMTAGRVEEARRTYGGMRKRAVALALLFVCAGFLIQLLGSSPGCCRALGIMPGG